MARSLYTQRRLSPEGQEAMRRAMATYDARAARLQCAHCGRWYDSTAKRDAHLTRMAGKFPHSKGGQARSRGGSNLAQERRRRVADAKAQPRTPVTRDRFWFKTLRRRSPVRRRPLDEEARQEYAERDYELEQSIGGLKVAIGQIRDEISRDVYDQGRKVDYRHALKGQKAFTPTGRRIRTYASMQGGSRDAITAARARIRELNDELRAVREERKSIADVLRHGELPGHYRKRMARRRARTRRRGR